VAKCSSRNGQSYQEYLSGCVNRRARPKEALIGLDFRHTVGGKESSYQIRRSWRQRGNGAIEKFTVHIDALPARTVAENWLHHIEEIMPANIAHLFLFDGEQAEQYAVAEKSSALIETAILNLLGLDIVSQLDKDLRTLERRVAIKEIDDGEMTKIRETEESIDQLRKEAERLCQKRGWMQTHETTPKKNRLSELEEQLRKAGGDLYERRNDIESVAKRLQSELAQSEDGLRSLAEGCLPLALVNDLLQSLDHRGSREREILKAKAALENLEDLKHRLLAHLSEHDVEASAVTLIESFIKCEADQKRTSAERGVENPMDEHTLLSLSTLRAERLGIALNTAEKQIKEHQELKRKTEEAELEWASVPSSADLAKILSERDSLAQEVATEEKELSEVSIRIEAVERQIAQNDQKLESLVAAATEKRSRVEEKARILKHSAKARETLVEFRRRVIRNHIRRIQTFVLESYQKLLRKRSLVERVIIDPDTFEVRLHDGSGRPVPANRLSAGERQLLAISILWGMARASGRPLPAAIDTPLGRLDAAHRKHLVERYFPQASHQVLLFSTDEEVHGEYLESLKGSVGRSYCLEYDDQTGSTQVVKGYLQ